MLSPVSHLTPCQESLILERPCSNATNALRWASRSAHTGPRARDLASTVWVNLGEKQGFNISLLDPPGISWGNGGAGQGDSSIHFHGLSFEIALNFSDVCYLRKRVTVYTTAPYLLGLGTVIDPYQRRAMASCTVLFLFFEKNSSQQCRLIGKVFLMLATVQMERLSLV